MVKGQGLACRPPEVWFYLGSKLGPGLEALSQGLGWKAHPGSPSSQAVPGVINPMSSPPPLSFESHSEMDLRRKARSLCHLAFWGGASTQVFGSLRPTLMKSLRKPPGGDRDELVWSDCPEAREVLASWRKGEVQEKFCSWSPPFYSQFIRSLGCLLMTSAGEEPYLNFSPFLNAPQPLAGAGSCGGKQGPTSVFFFWSLSWVSVSLSTLLDDNSASLPRYDSLMVGF